MKIKYITAAFLCLAVFVCQVPGQKMSKDIRITGKIRDNLNNPVAGAILTIDGIPSGSYTDQNGYYRLKVPETTTRIGVYVIPQIIIEDAVYGRQEMNFIIPDYAHRIIREQILAGESEKINIGYGTINKKDLTTAVSILDVKNSNYRYSDIYDMIKGKIPGVQVYGNSIIIRGGNPIKGGNSQPLFVVDGIVTDHIGDISPLEVRSIQILKDASASIYGFRGANGVILIDLKKGGD